MTTFLVPLLFGVGCLAGCTTLPNAQPGLPDVSRSVLSTATVATIARMLPPASSTIALASPRDTRLDAPVRRTLKAAGYAIADGNPPPADAHRIRYSVATVDGFTVLIVHVDHTAFTRPFAVSNGQLIPSGPLTTNESDDDE
ncbi:MAG: hypothetical protein M0006_15840 [Magnetospirillum sp.]|nr:hypothetical protein [Magnetospirillum sp.]